ncbi:MAG: glycoside hydrolase family protein [Phormidesmis sp.]
MVISDNRQHINSAGLALIKSYEGLAEKVFENGKLVAIESYQDMVGVWTIGYGHTKTAKPNMRISPEAAEALLQEDIAEFEAAVARTAQVPLSSDRFSALVAFAFNLGASALAESTLLKLLNKGDYLGAADQLPRWNKADENRSLGLTRRRLSERALFLSQPWEGYRSYEGPVKPEQVIASLGSSFSVKPETPVSTTAAVSSLETRAEAPASESKSDDNGPKSLSDSLRNLRLVEPMMHGEDVQTLQSALKAAGFFFNTTGFFDSITESVVKEFQRKKGLKDDGVVGSLTRSELGL